MAIAQFLNQHSALMLPVIMLFAAAAVLIWRKARPVFWGFWALALVGVGAFVLLNREPQTTTLTLDTAADIRAAIQTAGKPTLVEFYSNY